MRVQASRAASYRFLQDSRPWLARLLLVGQAATTLLFSFTSWLCLWPTNDPCPSAAWDPGGSIRRQRKTKKQGRKHHTTSWGQENSYVHQEIGEREPENKSENESSPGLPHLTTGTLPSMSGWESHSTIVFWWMKKRTIGRWMTHILLRGPG